MHHHNMMPCLTDVARGDVKFTACKLKLHIFAVETFSLSSVCVIGYMYFLYLLFSLVDKIDILTSHSVGPDLDATRRAGTAP